MVTEPPKPQRDVRTKAYGMPSAGTYRVAIRIGEMFGVFTVPKMDSRTKRKAHRAEMVRMAAESGQSVKPVRHPEKPAHKGYGDRLVADARKRAKRAKRRSSKKRRMVAV
jgi:histone acetyltransferase (RNA polymerase elongator complex component)